MRYVYSAFVWLYYCILFLLFFFIISFVFLVTLPFDKYRKVPNYTLSFLGRGLLKASPWWKINMEGMEKYDPSKSTVFIANHQSFLDMALIYHLPWKMKWISKKSLALIPVMGWLVWLTGHVTIERKKTSALKRLDNLVPPLKDFVPVMIFPEGTRTPDGKLQPFKNGPFLLVKEHGFTLQPMVIDGGYKALKSGSKLFDPKAEFKIKVLDPIDPEDFEDMKALKDHAYELMNRELEKIRTD